MAEVRDPSTETTLPNQSSRKSRLARNGGTPWSCASPSAMPPLPAGKSGGNHRLYGIKLLASAPLFPAPSKIVSAMKINGNEIRQGYIIEYQAKLWRVVKAQQVQMGNWRSYWQAELKDIKAGTKLNERFGSSDVVERVRLDEKDYQFLYKEGDQYTFMDTETYDQITLTQEAIGDGAV